MKRSNKLTLVFVFMVIALSTSNVFANEPVKAASANSTSTYNDFSVFSEEKYDQIEQNLLAGIKSDNIGLQTSSAYFLGEMKSDRAMIPLLRLVQNGGTEEARIIAALSLYKIESKIGMYRLKYLLETDDSELARRVFDIIYKKYVSDKYSFSEF
jgi:HEAT repeat protein